MTQMTKPDPRVEAVVRRLHGDLRRLTRAALARYGAVTTRGAPGDLHVVDRECIEAAVRAGLELAAEVAEERIAIIRAGGRGDELGAWVSVVIGEVASAIRALAKVQP